jgi:hypothetical protein
MKIGWKDYSELARLFQGFRAIFRRSASATAVLRLALHPRDLTHSAAGKAAVIGRYGLLH